MKKKKHPEHVNHERWLVSYADFITLLFAFFVVMFASSQVDTKKVSGISDAFAAAMGESFMMEGGRSILPEGRPPPPETEGGKGEGKLPKELEKIARALADKREEMSGLKVLQRRNEIVIRLSDNVLFDSGDDTVKEPAVRVLTSIANELRHRPVDIRVEGHTDDVPIRTARFRSNWDLSAGRATAVIAQLSGPGRIAPTRLSAAGYGEFHPIASNATPEGRAQNRRVDLVIASTVDEAKDTPVKTPENMPGAPSAEPSARPEEGAGGKGEIGPPLPEEDAGGDGEMGPPLPPDPIEEPAGEDEAHGATEAPHGAHGEPAASASAAPHDEHETPKDEKSAAPHGEKAAPPKDEKAAPKGSSSARPAAPKKTTKPPPPATSPSEEPYGLPLRH